MRELFLGFFFVPGGVDETTSLGKGVFGLAGLLIGFVKYILAVSTCVADQVSLVMYILAVSTCLADLVSLAFVFLKYVITDSFNYLPNGPRPRKGSRGH